MAMGGMLKALLKTLLFLIVLIITGIVGAFLGIPLGILSFLVILVIITWFARLLIKAVSDESDMAIFFGTWLLAGALTDGALCWSWSREALDLLGMLCSNNCI